MSRYIDIEPLMTPDNMVEEREDTGIDELPYKIKYGLDINVIRTAPTADVVEVRHGCWYFTEYEYFTCSVCGKSHFNFCDSTAEARSKLDNGEVYPYCPECGAKMDGGRREK